MKKTIVFILSISTIIISCWYFTKQLNYLDIVSTKNDQYSSFQKREIENRNDINDCQKEILKNQVDLKRTNKKEISKLAAETQFVLLTIIFIQLIILVTTIIMFRANKRKPI
jgi:peptidoglycan hydrolase CwlO-like protein